MFKVAFGRCDIPHIGHASLINEVDLFILSNGKGRTDTALRLFLLRRLGAPIEKIVVGNPYNILKKLSKLYEANELVVVTEEKNAGLANALNIQTIALSKTLPVSSTKIRALIKEAKYAELANFYLNDFESITLACTCSFYK